MEWNKAIGHFGFGTQRKGPTNINENKIIVTLKPELLITGDVRTSRRHHAQVEKGTYAVDEDSENGRRTCLPNWHDDWQIWAMVFEQVNQIDLRCCWRNHDPDAQGIGARGLPKRKMWTRMPKVPLENFFYEFWQIEFDFCDSIYQSICIRISLIEITYGNTYISPTLFSGYVPMVQPITTYTWSIFRSSI